MPPAALLPTAALPASHPAAHTVTHHPTSRLPPPPPRTTPACPCLPPPPACPACHCLPPSCLPPTCLPCTTSCHTLHHHTTTCAHHRAHCLSPCRNTCCLPFLHRTLPPHLPPATAPVPLPCAPRYHALYLPAATVLPCCLPAACAPHCYRLHAFCNPAARLPSCLRLHFCLFLRYYARSACHLPFTIRCAAHALPAPRLPPPPLPLLPLPLLPYTLPFYLRCRIRAYSFAPLGSCRRTARIFRLLFAHLPAWPTLPLTTSLLPACLLLAHLPSVCLPHTCCGLLLPIFPALLLYLPHTARAL